MIDFLKYRFLCLGLSIALVVIAIGAYFYKQHTRGYGFTYGIDFTGGTQALLKFEKPVTSHAIREALASKNWGEIITREFSDTEVLVRVQEFSNDAKGLADQMQTVINDHISDNKVTILQIESVGPGVGAELRWKSIRAVLISLIGILIYIGWRFWSMSFALGAVIALVHDGIIVLACLLFFDRPITITVIGAILAVLGYSVNDTIVIFAQIRKNLRKIKNDSLYNIVNLSINQTLRRSLLTSFATALSVLAMLLFGGEALRDFAFALLIGIVFGAFSSIYVASPIMMLFYKEKSKL